MKKILVLLLTVVCLSAFGQTTVPLWKTLPEVPLMPRADKSGLIPVNDIKLYYAIFNEHGKDPVILLHGGFVSSDEWGFEVPLLAKTHQVIVVDSRGHGRSSLGDQPLSYELMTSDVLQLMDYLKIGKASIVGWSDGGIIGMILAIKNPERISKLFTFGANYNLSGYKEETSDSTSGARFMTRATANYRKLSPTPDDFGELKKALGKMYSTEPNLSPAALKTIKAPTVIACGQYDQFIKQEHFRELAQLIPNAKLVILPNVAHGGPLQDPAGFHQAVINLLHKE
ncbi:alpha/beta fold hydrolase [Mucilaginibacter sp.]|jgi:pimeloyl-ACP methyl ester carboxylesterase|uniref:alpha/beta fold hydrolase n=1 Tax=Mucilaginibacter sp. TaxID=1882438 RepID=UPI0035669D9B